MTRGKASRLILPAVLATSLAAVVPALAGPGHHTSADNRRAAVNDAKQLLTRVVLPNGARPAPKSDHFDLGEPARPAGVKMVDQRTWWRVDEPLNQVFVYVDGHVPRGGRWQFEGGGGGGSGPSWNYVGFSFPARPGVLGIRWLVVSMIQLSGGSTGIRVDGQVQWIVPRPQSEMVPAGVRAVHVVRSGSSPISRTVTDATQVRDVIRLTDRLPALQPGVWSCPAGPTNSDTVTVTFMHGAGGPALARTTVAAEVGPTNTGCDAMGFWIGHHRQTPLVRARHFLKAVGRLLGVQLAERPY